MGLWKDHQGIRQDAPGKKRVLSPGRGCPLAIEREQLRQNFVRGVQTVGVKRVVKGPHPCMPLIAAMGERNPRERIRKIAVHGERLGRP